jgi:hypothetical protein
LFSAGYFCTGESFWVRKVDLGGMKIIWPGHEARSRDYINSGTETAQLISMQSITYDLKPKRRREDRSKKEAVLILIIRVPAPLRVISHPS